MFWGKALLKVRLLRGAQLYGKKVQVLRPLVVLVLHIGKQKNIYITRFVTKIRLCDKNLKHPLKINSSKNDSVATYGSALHRSTHLCVFPHNKFQGGLWFLYDKFIIYRASQKNYNLLFNSNLNYFLKSQQENRCRILISV